MYDCKQTMLTARRQRHVGRSNFFGMKVLQIETEVSYCHKTVCEKLTVPQLKLSVTDDFPLREKLSQFISCKLILCK